MDKTRAMERLKDERDYEDELVKKLDEYILTRLDELPDLNDKERERLRKNIEQIAHDSVRHSYLFSDLMQTVIEDEERQY
jgi:hypothetical protein